MAITTKIDNKHFFAFDLARPFKDADTRLGTIDSIIEWLEKRGPFVVKADPNLLTIDRTPSTERVYALVIRAYSQSGDWRVLCVPADHTNQMHLFSTIHTVQRSLLDPKVYVRTHETFLKYVKAIYIPFSDEERQKIENRNPAKIYFPSALANQLLVCPDLVGE